MASPWCLANVISRLLPPCLQPQWRAYGFEHGAPSALSDERLGRNGHRCAPLRRGLLSGAMGMASVTPSPLEKWREKVDIWGGVGRGAAPESGWLLQRPSGDSNCPTLCLSLLR
jgi:hypothetical protein